MSELKFDTNVLYDVDFNKVFTVKEVCDILKAMDFSFHFDTEAKLNNFPCKYLLKVSDYPYHKPMTQEEVEAMKQEQIALQADAMKQVVAEMEKAEGDVAPVEVVVPEVNKEVE